tara:strand:- start:12648 stop:14960 length:2313 start_codon:yes stop_codon:yes gene_type:complete
MKNKPQKTIIITSNCTWYLYNFRYELLRELNKLNYRLILIAPKDKYKIKISKFFYRTHDLFLKRGSINPINESLSILHIASLFLKYKPDLIHNFTIKPILYCSIASKLTNKSHIINHFTGLGPSFRSRSKIINLINYFLNPIYKKILNRNNTINIFHNKSDSDLLIKKGILNNLNIKIINGSGVNATHYKGDLLKKNYNKPINVLFPGRIIKEKGIIELVAACKELWSDGYKFKLNITGRIDLENKSSLNLNELKALSKNKNIIIKGYSENMKSVYKKTDIVILPSWREGLSKALLESASMGLPIITTDTPGCREVVKNNYSGLLVPVKNKEAIKKALRTLISDYKLGLLYGKNARKHVLKNFTVEKINHQIINIYKKLVKESFISKRLLYLITEDWFFCSHFLERALASKKKGFEILVCSNENKHKKIIENYGLKFIKVKFNRRGMNPFYELKILINIYSIYKSFQPDIVHHISAKPIIYGSIAARLTNIKSLINAPTGLGYVFSSNSLKAFLLRPIVKTLYKLLLNSHNGKYSNTKVIFENDDDLEYFINLGALRKKDSVIIRGAGINVTSKLTRYKKDSSIPIITLVARMLKDKGVNEFINAAKEIKNKNIESKFLLVGDIDPYNPSSLKSEYIKKQHKEKFIYWLGWVDNVEKILKETDILCLPSYREGLPKALIEGAALGLPIVTTNTVGCKDVVKDGLNGILVPIRDSKKLSEAILKLIKDKELRERMGIESHKIALNKFSSKIIIPQTLEIYNELYSQKFNLE